MMDNKGGEIHWYFSRVSLGYIAIPAVVQPLFLAMNYAYASNAPDFWTYWGLLFGSDIANLVLIYFTA